MNDSQDDCIHVFRTRGDKLVCEKCGTIAHGAADIVNKRKTASDISFDDYLLIMLYLLPEHRSTSETKLQKEIFLIDREGPKIVTKPPRAGFVPHKYGPCSQDVYLGLDVLEQNGYIIRSTDPDLESKENSLTPRGITKAEELILKLDSTLIDQLKKFVNNFDSFQSRALLRYVYNLYPIYTVNSEIKDKVVKKGGKLDAEKTENSRSSR